MAKSTDKKKKDVKKLKVKSAPELKAGAKSACDLVGGKTACDLVGAKTACDLVGAKTACDLVKS